MEGRLYPLNNDDFSILVTNSNVRHQLNTSRYSVLRHHCEDAARSMGKTKLRDVTIDELEGKLLSCQIFLTNFYFLDCTTIFKLPLTNISKKSFSRNQIENGKMLQKQM